MRWGIIFLFLFGYTQGVWTQELPKDYYQIKVEIDTKDYIITGHETITYFNKSGISLSNIWLNLSPNQLRKRDPKIPEWQYDELYYRGFEPGYIDIHQVEDDKGNSLSYTYEVDDTIIFGCKEKNILNIKLPKELLTGESFTFKIYFTTKVPERLDGSFGHHRKLLYLQFGWYPYLLVYKDGKWNKGISLIDVASYDVELVLPNNEVVVSTGVIKETKSLEDGRKGLFISADNARIFSLAISSRYELYSEEYKGIILNSYCFEIDKTVGIRMLEYAKEAIDFCEERFGKYPYSQLSIVENYSYDVCLAGGQMVYISTLLYRYPEPMQREVKKILTHEISHQWWGIAVGNDLYSETWLDEGLASHTETRFIDTKYGYFGDNMREWNKWLFKFYPDYNHRQVIDRILSFHFKDEFDEVILKPTKEAVDLDVHSDMVYEKGMYVFDMLRYLVGDEVYEKILKTYFERYKDKNADVEDFINVAEEVSEKELDCFFGQWLKTTYKVDFRIKEIKTAKEKDKYRTKIIIEKIGEIVMPVDIQITLKDGTKINKDWDGEEKEKEFEIITTSKVKSVHIDHENRILDVNRYNNRKPGKVEHRLYMPLISLPFDFTYPSLLPPIPPSDAYQIVYEPWWDEEEYWFNDRFFGGLSVRGDFDDYHLSFDETYSSERNKITDYSFGISKRNPFGVGTLIQGDFSQGEYHKIIDIAFQKEFYKIFNKKRYVHKGVVINSTFSKWFNDVFIEFALFEPLSRLAIVTGIWKDFKFRGTGYDVNRYIGALRKDWRIGHSKTLSIGSALTYNSKGDYLFTDQFIEFNFPIIKEAEIPIFNVAWFKELSGWISWEGNNRWDFEKKTKGSYGYYILGLNHKFDIFGYYPAEVNIRWDNKYGLDFQIGTEIRY